MSIDRETRLAQLLSTLTESGSIADLEEYLESCGVPVDLVWEHFQWNVIDDGGKPLTPPTMDQERRRSELFRSSADLVKAQPSGLALFGLYVWNTARVAFKRSYEFGRMIGGLEDFQLAWEAVRDEAVDFYSLEAGDAVAHLTRLLVLEIKAEDALCCGDIELHRQAVRKARSRAIEVRDLAANLGRLGPLRDYLHGVGEAGVSYYDAVAGALRATSAALGGRAELLEPAIDRLRNSESMPLTSVQKSELRAHRSVLERLQKASDSEWLTLDQVKFVYLYPFGLSGIAAGDVVAAVRAASGELTIAGVQPIAIRKVFEICDVWGGADFLQRRFEGASIQLPPVVLTHPDGSEIDQLQVEIRVSLLGNHYLRFEAHGRELNPHEAMFAMFRAAPEHGSIRVQFGESGKAWSKLSDLAAEIQSDFAAIVGDHFNLQVAAHSGRYHVLATVHEASTGIGPGASMAQRRQIRLGAHLEQAFGAQALLHTIPSGVESICDWAYFTVSEDTVLREVRKTGNLIVGTANSTVIVMLTTPSFGIDTYETIAEFVGTLDGLYRAWSDRLAEHHRHVTELIGGIGDASSAAELSQQGTRLRREQLLLHDFASEYRSIQSLIHSPRLMASPADTEALSSLLHLAGIERSEQDIAEKLGQLLNDRLEVHIDALAAELREKVERERERRARRSRSLIEAVLVAMAVVGLSGMVQVLQGTGKLSHELTWWSLGFILVAAIVCSLAVFRWSNPGKSDER